MSELKHVGVLGMRWGRRKAVDNSSLNRVELQKKAHSQKKDTHLRTPKAVNKMSKKELVKYLDSPVMNEKMKNVRRNKAAITAGKIAAVAILAGPFVVKKIRQVAPLVKIMMEQAANAKVAANIAGKVVIDSHFI